MKNTFLFIFLVVSFWVEAQTNKEQHIQQLLEFIQQEEQDNEAQLNVWWHYLEHPLYVSQLKHSELKELAFLSPLEIKNILAFCSKHKPILHLYELQYTPALSQQSFLLLMPFLRIQHKSKQLNTKNKQEVILRFAQTFKSAQTASQPEKIYTHFRSQQKWFRFGVQGEKDAGENWPHRGGFDFGSAHLYLQHPTKNIQVALGDYHIQIGQGLLLYQGYSNGVGAQITGIKRNNFRLKPYTGTNENDFFRGLATQLQDKKVQLALFYSNRWRDAKIYEDSTKSYFITFSNSGIHSSISEKEKKDQLKEVNYGISARINQQKFVLGWHYLHTHYKIPQEKITSTFRINGKNFHNTGFDFSFDIKNHHFFGEWASDFQKKAWLVGSLSPLSQLCSLALLYSKNESGYHAPYAQLFNGQATGAYHFYAGLLYEINPKINFSFYHITASKGTAQRATLLFPNDRKFFYQLSYRKRHVAHSYLQYQYSKKQIATAGEYKNLIPNPAILRKLRWHSEISLNKAWKFRWRVEFQDYSSDTEKYDHAWMIYQELKYKKPESSLSFLIRYALFDTQFQTRIYAYEQQVRYQYASTLYYGQGEQIYGLLHYKMNKRWALWLRCSYFSFQRLQENHNTQHITAQIRFNI